jgi:hypothetical protein
LGPSDTSEVRKAYEWNHVRLSSVVLIAVVMAIAIVCVVIAVHGSAHRADEVALDNERRLFTRALHHHAERVLREVEGIATSEAGVRNIRMHFDPDWVQNRVGCGCRRCSTRILYSLPTHPISSSTACSENAAAIRIGSISSNPTSS